MLSIINGELPILSEELSNCILALDNSLWSLCHDCWKFKADDRPEMEMIRSTLLHMDVQSRAGKRLQTVDTDTNEQLKSYVNNVLAEMKHLDLTEDVRLAAWYSSLVRCAGGPRTVEVYEPEQATDNGKVIASRLTVKALQISFVSTYTISEQSKNDIHSEEKSLHGQRLASTSSLVKAESQEHYETPWIYISSRIPKLC